MWYSVCEFTFETNIALPELAGTELGGDMAHPEPHCRFWYLPGRSRTPRSLEWLTRYHDEAGHVWLTVGRYEGGYLLRFTELANWFLSHDAREVHCYAAASTPLETIGHLFANHIIPLVLAQWGLQVLHASTVWTPFGAVAFVGRSRAGKSTLAASLGQDKYPVLGDDYLRVEKHGDQLLAIPAQPCLRLYPDSINALGLSMPYWRPVAHYSNKRRIQLDCPHVSFCRHRTILRRLYVITPPEETETQPGATVRIEALSFPDAFVALLGHSFRGLSTHADSLQKEFARLASLVPLLDVYCLRFRRDFALLPQVQAALLHHLGSA